uniref:Uncharacterized protein n=1 Tax=Tanacetum cinerariifolium TaxID=118510 RepID=A0A699KK68_TANCI|nr:hypothetical protein [Tanacetum cinerariifolium]
MFKERWHLRPPLVVVRQRFYDKEKEQMRDIVALATLLDEKSAKLSCKKILILYERIIYLPTIISKMNSFPYFTYIQRIRFTNETTIIRINATKVWYYTNCSICLIKVNADESTPMCRDYGPQLYPRHRGNHIEFTMWSDMATGFDKKVVEAKEKLVKLCSVNCRSGNSLLSDPRYSVP